MHVRVLRNWFLGVALAAGSSVALPAFADTPAPEHAEVAASGTGAPEDEGAEDHEHHVPKFEEYNFFYGFLGERDDVEPSILWRPKGTPVPFGAMLLNSAVLYWLLIRFAKKPIANALKSRKASILRGMEEAGQMKKEAEARLADYEQKLATVDQEIERVRQDMRAAGERERKRILAEAKDKRARMERDAQTLIGQELKAAREGLLSEMTRSALRSAENTLRSKVTAADQNRLAEEYLAGIKSARYGAARKSMSSGDVAERYARAIFELGVEAGQVVALSEQVRSFADTYAASRELQAVLDNPMVELEKRQALLVDVAGKVGLSGVGLNAIRMLADRSRLASLPEIARRLASLADDKAGVVRAVVTSAGPLPESFYERLMTELESATSRKVAIDRQQDPSLIAGVVTRIGDNTIDGSVKGRLAEIERQLSSL